MELDFARLERSAATGWPAEVIVPIGPWQLRVNHGITHRANSVFTAASPRRFSLELSKSKCALSPSLGTPGEGGVGAILPDVQNQSTVLNWIEQAENLYRQYGLPALFQISRASVPVDLDAILEARAYGAQRWSEIWWADSSVIAGNQAGFDLPADSILTGLDEPDEGWFACAFGVASPSRSIQEQICRRVSVPRQFVSIRQNDQAIACGMGTISQNLTCVHCMVTAEPWRRRGLASHLLGQLARWSLAQGVRHLFLQVMSNNPAAKNLYAKSGFVISHPYHYRTKSIAGIP